LHVILIDDDEIDAEAIARLLQRHPPPYRLTVFSDGRAAQEALSGPFGQALHDQPFLILLDLNMPRMNGFEFLQWLRTLPALRRAVVFVLSTSTADLDIHQAYSTYQAAGYLAKPQLGKGYMQLLPVLDTYAQTVVLPFPATAA
jgi:CheY-like chemotaxis protein